jgi:hypothetical protein
MPVFIESWSLTSLRERLIKTGVRMARPARHAAFQMADLGCHARSSPASSI